MDREKILAGEEIEWDEMDSLVLSHQDDLTNEETIKKVVDLIKDTRFADPNKNESGQESIKYTILTEDNTTSSSKWVKKAKNKQDMQQEKQPLKVAAYLDITDGKNINPEIKSPLVRNLKVICVWKPERIDGFSSFLKSIKNR